MSKKSFNDFRFAGLNAHKFSNKYLTMDRLNDDESKIVVKVAEEHLFESKYGYGLILDRTHVVWLKSWQVSMNWYGNEIVLDRNFWDVKEWGIHMEFDENDPEENEFSHWVEIAKIQREHNNAVKWSNQD